MLPVASPSKESNVAFSDIVRQFLVALSAALTGVSTGCWIGWPSSAIPRLKTNETGMTMSSEEISWMVASLDVGVLVSPFPSGYLMDSLGRKRTTLLSGGILLLAWILVGVAFNQWFLHVAGFLFGLCKGTLYTVLPNYLSEIASVTVRGALSTMHNSTLWLGIVFEFVIGAYVPLSTLNIVSGVIPIIFFLTFPFMPDSPFYLIMKGNRAGARDALLWLRNSSSNQFKAGNSCEDPIEKELNEITTFVGEDMKIKGKFTDLATNASCRRALIIVVVLLILSRFAGVTCLIFYASTTLPSTFDLISPGKAAAIFSIIYEVASILSAPLIDRYGRKPLLIISTVGSGLMSGISAIFYYLDRETDVDVVPYSWIPYVCLLLSGLFQPPIHSVPLTLQGELFPTNVKAHASAVSTVFFALSSFFVDKLYPTVDVNIGVYFNYVFFFVSSLVHLVFVCVFVFETKNKTFQDIQQILKK